MNEILAEHQAIIESLTTGKPLDPEIAHRIEERAQRAKELLRQEKGVQEIGVNLIREFRETGE